MNIKLNDTSDNEENTAGFMDEVYYPQNRGRGSKVSDENSKGEKS